MRIIERLSTYKNSTFWHRILEWIGLIAIIVLCVIIFCVYRKYKSVIAQKNKIAAMFIQQKAAQTKRLDKHAILPKVKVHSDAEMKRVLDKMAARDKVIARLRKELKRYGKITAATQLNVHVAEGKTAQNKPPDKVQARDKGKVYTKFLEANGLRLATVYFNTGNLKAPFSYKIHPLGIRLTIMQAVNPNGPDRLGFVAYIVTEDGKRKKALIDDTKINYTYPDSKKPRWKLSFSPFKMELWGGGSLLYNQSNGLEFGGSVGLSTHLLKLSYANRDVWRFLGLGIGYSSPHRFAAVIFPASFNLGTFIKPLRDTFLTVGAGVGIGVKGVDFLLVFGVSTTL